MPPEAKQAVVLLSGGLDSATTLAIARRAGFACHALSFDYGQRHRFELEAARRVAGADVAATGPIAARPRAKAARALAASSRLAVTTSRAGV